ncbi:SDR family oxidoreductase [Blastomonas sp.]|uniref:SDR family oxidoreductase n=1 Tax=Blastomonas sp. TaxID=1909299 RepID=UPI00262694A7|nr:SDR family NAD(P)-dependent oxidoreductase [Blastomonas sp.]MDM7956649.1 SDR family NAD(P)-dependent oxidoreductase [Blastomonas sp.]
MNDHASKVAIVTGASKGMGRHFVLALAAAGWRVAGLARASAELSSLPTHDGQVIAIECDIASPQAVKSAVERTAAQFGRIDLIVNNAAVFWPFMLEDASDADIAQHVSINVLGPIWLIRAAIPHLKQTSGQIVSLSSESVNHPFPMLTIYAATKAAVETLSAGLRGELQADNIRVSILRSGSVAGSTGSANWSVANSQAFYKKIVETGHASMAGEAASPESMAAALLAIVSLPRDVNADLIEVRAARAGVPEGARFG